MRVLGSTFTDILGLGDQLFTVIVLVVCAGITSHMCFGFGTKKAKETFVALILVLIVGTQFFHLITAVTYIPVSKNYSFDRDLHRTDCLESVKGGKRAAGSKGIYDHNPCFCLSSIANCTDHITGATITGSCPIDDSATCTATAGDKIGSEIKVYLSSKRDCRGGKTAYCTQDQPCTPCELNQLVAFGAPRCRTCSTEYNGDCNFIPGQGPYCYESFNSKKVVPCKTCCTEPMPLIVNGTCY